MAIDAFASMAWGIRNLISTQTLDGAARAGGVERAHAIYAQFLPLLVLSSNRASDPQGVTD